jgi:hypothetical protein
MRLLMLTVLQVFLDALLYFLPLTKLMLAPAKARDEPVVVSILSPMPFTT